MNGEFILYTTEDGRASIQLRAVGETVLRTQLGMAELFETTKQKVSIQIQKILEECELIADSVVKESLTTQIEDRLELKRAIVRVSEAIQKP